MNAAERAKALLRELPLLSTTPPSILLTYFERAILAAETAAYRKGVEDAAAVANVYRVRALAEGVAGDSTLIMMSGAAHQIRNDILALKPRGGGQ